MKFTTILLALGTTAPAVLAADMDLVDMWVDTNFNGPKYTGRGDVGQCVNLPSNFNDNLSSGKARPGYKCTIWPDADCKTNRFDSSFDDKGSGASFPDWINDRASSWRCYRA
ncbi:hypothetical protein B0H65DRAFT_470928 [Neurospora tetraspora]|uniref:Uncharacterized protein n=1 Tax=Neurospora tetraspora TaxID=94610 RepID=A0AAE0JED3_9PEZI|nr:hypothetical protein B0H65DRAFT_470928 [Neurospora tetraspora]